MSLSTNLSVSVFFLYLTILYSFNFLFYFEHFPERWLAMPTGAVPMLVIGVVRRRHRHRQELIYFNTTATIQRYQFKLINYNLRVKHWKSTKWLKERERKRKKMTDKRKENIRQLLSDNLICLVDKPSFYFVVPIYKHLVCLWKENQTGSFLLSDLTWPGLTVLVVVGYSEIVFYYPIDLLIYFHQPKLMPFWTGIEEENTWLAKWNPAFNEWMRMRMRERERKNK